jgi:hypothetical protein
MTVFSVVEAATRLGIDAKTLHRWLTAAQLPLLCHPHDARKKGISEHHLQTLARLHHREVTSPSPQPSLLIPTLPSPLPDALLTLPEHLAALQAQVAALHQQVTDLTALLQQPVQSPSSPPTPAPQPTPAKRPSSSTPSASSSRPAAAKTPPKPTHVIARVEYSQEGHYVVICPKQGMLPFAPDSPEWFAWVAEQDSFRFVGKCGQFTAHHEWRVPKGAWRAHRNIRNRVHTQRLAPNHELTIAVLEQAATAIQALQA